MRILAVDDDTELTQLLQLIFESRGFGVTIANSGQQALQALENELPEVIVLDLMMPGMSGEDVCRKIRANPRTANIPIIVLTAKSDLNTRREMMKAGISEYLVKPISPMDLVQRTREVIAQSTSSVVNVLT